MSQNPITVISVFLDESPPAVLVNRKDESIRVYRLTEASMGRLLAKAKRNEVQGMPWGWMIFTPHFYNDLNCDPPAPAPLPRYSRLNRYSRLQIVEAAQQVIDRLTAEDFDPTYVDIVDYALQDLLDALEGKLKTAEEEAEPEPETAFGWPVVGQIVSDDDLGNRVEWNGGHHA